LATAFSHPWRAPSFVELLKKAGKLTFLGVFSQSFMKKTADHNKKSDT